VAVWNHDRLPLPIRALTISLAFIVAGFQTAWVRTSNDKYLRLTRFYGELFLINFAMGVVTGIVQEFQFGMNWSDYSRFVGDISARLSRSKACSRSSSSRPSWGCGSSAGASCRSEIHPGHDLDRRGWNRSFRVLHPGGERLDAASRSVSPSTHRPVKPS